MWFLYIFKLINKIIDIYEIYIYIYFILCGNLNTCTYIYIYIYIYIFLLYFTPDIYSILEINNCTFSINISI